MVLKQSFDTKLRSMLVHDHGQLQVIVERMVRPPAGMGAAAAGVVWGCDWLAAGLGWA